MQTLIDPFMKPEISPIKAYAPEQDVISLCFAQDVPVIIEIYKRQNGTFGFRYSAWVAWRDAGNVVRSHSWWQSAPRDTLITDSIAEAQTQALAFAASKGILISGGWASPSNISLQPDA